MSAFRATVAAWLQTHLAETTIPDVDRAEFEAWLSRNYEPLAGGWQY